jgi:iron complex outermembrane receptor protein
MRAHPGVLLRAFTALFIAEWSTHALTAQTTSPAAPAKAGDDVLVLSAFKVSTNSTSPYQGKDANSAGRIRASLLDTPQSVSVITKDFMEDIGTGRPLDAMKFSASVTESNFPNRLGRITLRGFQQDAAQQSFFVDGFRYSAISAGYNADASNLQRIEIVKGPNSIIAPAGSPGGSVNMITKSPSFTPGGYVKVQAGQYLSNRAEVDVTGPLSLMGGKFAAYRVTAMYTDADGFQDNAFSKVFLVDPSLTLVLGAGTELTLKGHYAKVDVSAMNLPLDPRVGLNDKPVLYPGLSRTWSGTGGFRPSIPGEEGRIIADLTHKFSENLQARAGVMLADLTLSTLQDGGIGGIVNSRGNADPTTGVYTPGTTFTVFNYGLPTQNVVATTSAMPDFTNRSVGFNQVLSRQHNRDGLFSFQNDYVYTREFSKDVHSTTVAGFSFNRHRYTATGYANVSTPLVGTIDAPDYAAMYATLKTIPALKNFLVKEVENTRQFYVAEVLKLFGERAYVNGSVSRMSYGQYITPDSVFTTNPVGTAVAVPANTGFVSNAVYPTPGFDRIEGSKTDISYGLLVKATKEISLFYGHTANTNPPTLNNIGGTSKQNQWGEQYEIGAKASLLDGRVDLSLTHFDITQNNVFVYDVLTNVFLPLGTTTSKGWEFELNARVTPEFSTILAVSDFKARNGFGQLLRAVPDQSGALALKYQFNGGALKGGWVMLSADYMAKRAGDIPGTININGASAAPGTVVGTVNGRTLTGIPVLPTFYLEARTIYNLTAGYTFNQNWKAWLKIENLADKDYIGASLNRGVLTPGNPRNLTGSITYKF